MSAMTKPDRARLSLEGLSVGDAFGERFFTTPATLKRMLDLHDLPDPPWHFTDDTVMAFGIVENLERHGAIDRDELARAFAIRFREDPVPRGYGYGAQEILAQILGGISWRAAAGSAFGGKGSMGNGGGMRAAPLGAWFADDSEDRIVAEARASAEVTHAHSEGQAGAIAVALAAAWAWRRKHASVTGDLLGFVLEHTPSSLTSDAIALAREIPAAASVKVAAAALGTGARVLAQDTVPFALWCAARHLDDYEACLWTTVSGLGDRDTTCAIAGGVVALSVGLDGIPAAWRRAREPLP
jgi:ADP-ribosylglycohydrolase